MDATVEGDPNEPAMRAQLLAVLEELCRGLTLREVREWYAEALAEPAVSPASRF